MNTFKKLFFSILFSLSSISFAEVSLSGNIAVTTDYIWRGLTQNAGDPSVSGGFDLEHDSGFYIGLWAANVNALNTDDDGGTENDLNDDTISIGSMELDGYLGFSGSLDENSGFDVGYIAYTYPGVNAWDFEEIYVTFDFYGVYLTYADGVGDAADYGEIGYSIDAGPGSFSISYGDYDNNGTNYLVGYDWSVGDFTLGFYYSEYRDDDDATEDQDGGYFTISY